MNDFNTLLASGLPYEEIGKRTGLSYWAVKRRAAKSLTTEQRYHRRQREVFWQQWEADLATLAEKGLKHTDIARIISQKSGREVNAGMVGGKLCRMRRARRCASPTIPATDEVSPAQDEARISYRPLHPDLGIEPVTRYVVNRRGLGSMGPMRAAISVPRLRCLEGPSP